MPEESNTNGNRRSRLVLRLVGYIFLFSSIITIVSTAYQLYTEYERDLLTIQAGLDQVEKSHLDSIISHLWVYDLNNLKVQLNGILQLPDVKHVEIKTHDGHLVSAGQAASGKTISREFELTKSHRGQHIYLGNLSVTASLEGVHNRLIDRVIIILSTQAVKTFLVTIFIFILFYYMIGRRLELLALHTSSLNLNTLDKPFEIGDDRQGKHNDELDQVTQALNEMRTRLRNGLLELRQSEAAIRESETKFRQLAENIPEVFWLGSADWQEIFYISPAYETIWGKSCESLYQNPFSWTESIFEADQKQITSLFPVQWTAPFSSFVFPEYRIVRPDGQLRWILARAVPIVDKNGHVLRIAGIATDITDRKNADQKIEEISQLLSKVIEGTTDAIFIKDLKNHYILANTATCRVLGKSRDEIIGKTDRDLFPEASIKEIESVDSQVMRTGKPIIAEERLQTSDGNTIWLTNKSPYLDDKGNMIGIIGISRNVTQIKKTEQEKEQLKRRLAQAQKMESIGTLAGGIAHDFNNILFPLMGYAEMLMEDLPDNSQAKESANQIFQAATRAKNLVRQILTLSRQNDQELKPLRVQAILKETIKLLDSSIPKTIRIEQDIDEQCGFVIADPTQIHQIIMNLSTNAYHAMIETGGSLKFILEQVEIQTISENILALKPGQYVLLKVIDTGKGINSATMDKIFDPYFTTKEMGKGTGLGLSIVQGIVKSCHGDVTIYSEQGKGTEVHVYLPVVEKYNGKLSSKPDIMIQTGTEQILLVDDEESIVKMEKQLLERLGYAVTGVVGSRQAMEIFKKNPDQYDLIITDMTMPDMTGLQLATEVKEIRPDTPVIICTGFSDQINAESSKSFNIQGYINKPIVKREISQIIRDVLDKRVQHEN